MRLQPIVYVTDMEASLAWYAGLLDAAPAQTSEHWSTFDLGGSTLALHLADEPSGPGSVELSLVVGAPIEAAHTRVPGATPIVEQPFGRSFTVTDPDGTTMQVNEHR